MKGGNNMKLFTTTVITGSTKGKCGLIAKECKGVGCFYERKILESCKNCPIRKMKKMENFL